MNDELRLPMVLSLALMLGLVPGCPGGVGMTQATTAASGSTTDSGSTGPGVTSMPVTDDADSSSGSSGPGTVGGSTTAAATDTCEDLPLGSSCVDPCDCESEQCFVVGPLGGVCSECDEASDCEPITGYGCNFGNPLTGEPALCGDGTLGQGCEDMGDCVEGLFCNTLIEVPGILSAATCSDCEGDLGCMDADICVPTYNLASIAGHHYCAPPGSVPDDEGCNLTGDGMECTSGQCAPASLMGIPVVAVCSPCNEDSDCGGGETCQLPEVMLEGTMLVLVPGLCV